MTSLEQTTHSSAQAIFDAIGGNTAHLRRLRRAGSPTLYALARACAPKGGGIPEIERALLGAAFGDGPVLVDVLSSSREPYATIKTALRAYLEALLQEDEANNGCMRWFFSFPRTGLGTTPALSPLARFSEPSPRVACPRGAGARRTRPGPVYAARRTPPETSRAASTLVLGATNTNPKAAGPRPRPAPRTARGPRLPPAAV
jgi:hypothetical protein